MTTSSALSTFRTTVLLLITCGSAVGLGGCGSMGTASTKPQHDPSLEHALSTPQGSTGSPTMSASSGSSPTMPMSASTTPATTPSEPSYTSNTISSNTQMGLAMSTQPMSSQAMSTQATPGNALFGTGVMPRHPGKLDPFWIETTAEADRAVWESAANMNGVPMNPLAASAMSANPAAMPMRDDGAEGLSHVTFAPEGADFDPCISRDGSFMVYASTQHRATSDIYMKRTDGRTITQLTSDPSNDIMPAISPDGQRIAFASSRAGSWDIYVMSARGGQAVQITADAAQELHPSWSPDGKRLVYCKMGQISGRWELWVSDVNNGASAEFIGFGMFPQWCPKAATGIDGRDKILFQRSRERGGRAFSVWTVDYRMGDASSPTEIVSSPNAAMINAGWSPDGQRIVFATIENPNQQSAAAAAGGGATYPSVASDLWMANIDGSGRVNLTSGQFMNLMPFWGADGRIYYVSDRAGVPNIWSMTTDKAIQAATGNAPANPALHQHEVAHVPEQHETAENAGQ